MNLLCTANGTVLNLCPTVTADILNVFHRGKLCDIVMGDGAVGD